MQTCEFEAKSPSCEKKLKMVCFTKIRLEFRVSLPGSILHVHGPKSSSLLLSCCSPRILVTSRHLVVPHRRYVLLLWVSWGLGCKVGKLGQIGFRVRDFKIGLGLFSRLGLGLF